MANSPFIFGLTYLDCLAVLWFLACWIGYTLYADRSRAKTRTMSHAMSHYRQRWMDTMLDRDNRIVDIQIIGNQLNGAAFFASTMILTIGGLFALLGATDQAMEVLQDFPLTVHMTRTAWELKVLTIILIFIYGFFKFAWAFRLYNYCSVLIGSAPIAPMIGTEGEETARRAGAVNNLAAWHFNQGMRAYFLVLASLAWFVHPLLFMAATAWVIRVLYRREFQSKSLRAVREPI